MREIEVDVEMRVKILKMVFWWRGGFWKVKIGEEFVVVEDELWLKMLEEIVKSRFDEVMF